MLTLLFDFGLVILVWLVQLVIYPSFRHFGREGLNQWHPKYTSKVTLVVLPLMAGQLLSHAVALYNDLHILQGIIFLLVISTWGITFLYAVPAHQKIGKGIDLSTSIDLLIRVNWIRTIIWSAIFILSFVLEENPVLWY